MISSDKPSFPFHDFRLGSTTQIARILQHPLQAAVSATLVMSYQHRALAPLEGTPFRLYADLSTVGDGNALFLIDTLAPLGESRIKPDSFLCSVAVACQLATAPLVWRVVLNRYLSYTASAPFGHRLGSAGLMPKTLPWLCGFSFIGNDYLTPTERQSLHLVTQLIGLHLLEQCETGVRRTAERGQLPAFDPVQFPELIDWET